MKVINEIMYIFLKLNHTRNLNSFIFIRKFITSILWYVNEAKIFYTWNDFMSKCVCGSIFDCSNLDTRNLDIDIEMCSMYKSKAFFKIFLLSSCLVLQWHQSVDWRKKKINETMFGIQCTKLETFGLPDLTWASKVGS